MCKKTKPGEAGPAIVRGRVIVSTFSQRAAHRSKVASAPPPRRSAGSRWFAAILTLAVTLFPLIAWGQSYNWNNANTSGGGGFVPGIVFNPSQKNLIYLRTDIGGAYRWDPVNLRWIPLMDWVGFDDWNTLGVESIATDPVHRSTV
jgi:hypothetical protein